MAHFHNPALIGASGQAGYQISRSLRFNSADSAYLTHVPASASSTRTKGTFSFWIKPCATSGTNGGNILGAADTYNYVQFYQETLYFGNTSSYISTAAVFRDFSAWYHVVCIFDTTLSTANDRMQLYVNNVRQVTGTFNTQPTQNSNFEFLNTVQEYNIGRRPSSPNYYINAYLTEVNFIDGQALTPSSFGETDAITGIWKPKKFTGTYGTNGFYLPFSNSASADTLPLDTQPLNVTRYTTPGTYTYTVPAYTTSLVVEVWGGGGGGAQAPSGGTNATNGGQSSFNGTVIANGGNFGTAVNSGVGANGTGGTASGGDVNTTGNTGNSTSGASSSTASPSSGNSSIAGVIGPGGFSGVTGFPVGSGGGGAYWTGGSVPTGGAGGSGGYSKKTYGPGAISGNVTVVVGAGGSAGIGLALNGGIGTAGMVRITVDGATTPNDWYQRNFSVSGGAGHDSLTDTPTPYADGGNGRGNYCTLNPAIRPYTVTSVETISDGNLQITNTGSGVTGSGWGTFNVTSGKWYYEATVTAAGGNIWIGWSNDATKAALGTYTAALRDYAYTYKKDGNKCNNSATGTAYGASYTTNDVIGVALDIGGGTIEFFKNGTSQGTAFTGVTATGGFIPGVSVDPGTTTVVTNFGQRAFAYTPPSGFLALNTQNLPEPTIKKPGTYMDVKLYTGTGSTQSISGFGFSPDLVWAKARSTTYFHNIVDSVRGTGKVLYTNTTGADDNNSNTISALNSDGFTVGTDTSANANGTTYVAWCWDKSATPGFDIVTFTGNGAAARTDLTHNLGVAPKMYIIKNRSISTNWFVYHESLGNNGIWLNLTNGSFANSSYFSGYPSSTTFYTSTDSSVNGNGNSMVAYLWSEVAGFSKFGSYTGNGSTDGPFVFTGMRSRFLLVKRTDTTDNWRMYDTARNTYNAGTYPLYPNLSNAEDASTDHFDWLSNGFKCRSTNINASGGTYVFAAFAESPFKYSLAR